MSDHLDEHWMQQALHQADLAAQAGEVPVGAVIVRENICVGRGHNQQLGSNDPSAHAEIIALRNAAQSENNYRLSGATVYVTIEPCTMCFGAMIHARITRLVYAAKEPRAGVVESQLKLADTEFYNHKMVVCGGVNADEAAAKMQAFFRARR
jgi:tRNA(adenine34) deaminase